MSTKDSSECRCRSRTSGQGTLPFCTACGRELRPRVVFVAGNIGSGKSTLALKLRQKLAHKHRAQWESIRPDAAHNLFFRLLNIDQPNGIDIPEGDYSQVGTGEQTSARKQVESLMQRTFLLETYFRIKASLEPRTVFGGGQNDFSLPDGVLIEYWPRFSVEVMAKAMGTDDVEGKLRDLLDNCEQNLPSSIEQPDAILMVAEDTKTLIERNARRADSRRNERVSERVVDQVEKRNRRLLSDYVFQHGNELQEVLSTAAPDDCPSDQWRKSVVQPSPSARWWMPLTYGSAQQNLIIPKYPLFLNNDDVDKVMKPKSGKHEVFIVRPRLDLGQVDTVELSWKERTQADPQWISSNQGRSAPQRVVGVEIEIKAETANGKTIPDLKKVISYESEEWHEREVRECLSRHPSVELKKVAKRSEWEVRKKFNEIESEKQNLGVLERLEQVVTGESTKLWMELRDDIKTDELTSDLNFGVDGRTLQRAPGTKLSDPPVKLVVVRDGVPDGGRSKFGKGLSSTLANWLREL
jgi:deoxyadenosine/deoxycytidine kinase